jgi:transcriptional regulator
MPAEQKSSSLVQGTLHMLILKTLALEPMHGYGIGVRLERISKGVFQINAGSLFPALRRLERDGLIAGEWQVTENNRRGKYYALTAHGRTTPRRETRDWEQQSAAIARIMSAGSASSRPPGRTCDTPRGRCAARQASRRSRFCPLRLPSAPTPPSSP